MLDLLQRAAGVALPNLLPDRRTYWVGAIGVRADGAVVSSRNGAAQWEGSPTPGAHAEGRLLRKLDRGATIYVARVAREDWRSLRHAKPCAMCQTLIKAYKVTAVYYSIDNERVGLWIPATGQWGVSIAR